MQHASCSEQFYKECFIDALKDQRGSNEEKRQMLEILKRVEEEHGDIDIDSDDDVGESIEERLAGLDLDKDTDALWERLTTDERNEFKQLMKEGKLGGLVTVWRPWWKAQDKKLIKEFNLENESREDNPEESGDVVCQCPKVLEKIPKLTELLRSCKPADCVQFNLIEVLFTYVYIAHVYNGSHFDLAVQSAQDVLRISNVLSENHRYSSTEEALHSVIQKLIQEKSANHSISFTSSLLSDVIRVLIGPSRDQPLLYTMAALSDLHRLLTKAKKLLSKDTKTKHSDEDDRASVTDTAKMNTQLFHSRKKLMFLLAWCGDYSDILKPLAMEVHAEYVSMTTEEQQHLQVKNKLEESWGGSKPPRPGKKLIEELT
ncbi:zinc finger HIT domain-containing protein 2-like isoform X2 [Ptychodera flava]|uniref:zinc finger HIT domain-containing protein 2-like isoform X2 n=1 Tax=Ptychodera flava TaxID=63121 RepID=UPI00396A79D9